ncbi:hypothetical protein M199_gp062 [Halogranum tailed virus 1]|uniref:Uncharacterized protein n=1 Tax=Halogranum tailed virus 1 TaxID=1273749 RepID=R4T782_9CAUD|nr:hypothetical protein M199_gp062 [Halogranum tailed virus 1]AGM11604.1 hypothetical protein HGTV1_307 [Halogranum tailed virus 1]
MGRTPDGMASMASERKHMREMRRLEQQDAPPWELAAFDEDGNELYRTEAFHSKEAAQAECDDFEEGTAWWADGIDDEVAYFKPAKR